MSKTTLIRLAAGDLDVAEAQAARAHLEQCGACRGTYEEHLALHDLLGEWSPAQLAGDLWPAVAERLEREPVVIRPAWTRYGRLARVAAAVAIGVGLGYVAGQLATSRSGPAIALPLISADEALEVMRFDYVESPSATGLYTTVSELTAPQGAEEGVG